MLPDYVDRAVQKAGLTARGAEIPTQPKGHGRLAPPPIRAFPPRRLGFRALRLPRSPFAILLVFLAALAPATGQAQSVLSDEAQISLVTILPGTPVYTVYGHSAIRVHDPLLGLDRTYNYGTFDFGNPFTFVAQFAYGKLDYFLSINQPYPRVVEYYWTVEERPIIEQVLNLSPGQRNAIFRFLEWNVRPENAYYRYDFFFDNCSTRIRDVFEDVLGESVQFAPLPDPDRSFRDLIALPNAPFLTLAMHLGLGLPADRIATPRESTFLPRYLMDYFDHATVTIDGAPQPLVARTDTVVWSEERARREPSLPWPTLLTWLLFAFGLFLTYRDVRRLQPGRRYVDGLLYGLSGFAGLVIVFLWFVSLHEVTQGNLNLSWAWPTHLAAAVLLRRARPPQWLGFYLLAAAATGLILVLGWPFWPQELPPVALPFVLLLAVRSAALAYVIRKIALRARHPEMR